MTLSHVAFEGTIMDEPILRVTPTGISQATFKVQTSDRKKDESGKWVKVDQTYFTVTCWRSLAEHVAESLSGGDLVVITGRLKHSSWTDRDGNKRTTTEVEADNVGLSLRFESVPKSDKKKTSNNEKKDDPWASGAPF